MHSLESSDAVEGAETSVHNMEFVKDSDTANFVTDVLESSKQVPVIVDFWTPRSEHCKQLDFTLEKLVNEAGGAIRMVKINVDENQSLASEMGVQSVPAICAYKEGQPVDGFVGALTEIEIKIFIENLGTIPTLAETILATDLEVAKAALDANDFVAAAKGFGAVVQEDPDNLEAVAGLATIHIEINALDEARQTLNYVSPDKANDPILTAVWERLEQLEEIAVLDETDQILAILEENPDDHQVRYDLALELNEAGEHAQAVDHLIQIITRDNEWNENAARVQLLQLFDDWGPTDPMTIKGRRKLSLVLFS